MTTPIIVMTILVVAGLIPLSNFIYRYIRHSPFESTWQGIAMLGQKVVWFLMFVFLLVSYAWPDMPGRRIAGFVIFGLIIVFFWLHLWLLRQVQAKYPYDRFTDGPPPHKAWHKRPSA